MKKIMMMSVLAVSIAFSACAQKLKDADVPVAVKTSFAKQYPGAVTKWEKEDGKYEANFKKDGNTMSAMFAPNGVFTESEIDIKVANLPATVLAYVKANYKGKAIKESAKITKANGTINYEAEVNGIDIIFDGKGKFIKEVKD